MQENEENFNEVEKASKPVHLASPRRPQRDEADGTSLDVGSWNPKTGEEVLIRIVERKTTNPDDSIPVTFSDWFAEMDLNVVEKIQAGTTSLQVKLKEGKL